MILENEGRPKYLQKRARDQTKKMLLGNLHGQT